MRVLKPVEAHKGGLEVGACIDMKKYVGIGTGTVVGGKQVLVNDEPLKHIMVHSPDGFNWGYGGSGPADLALAILADLMGEEEARKHYQAFKGEIIAELPQDADWTLTEEEIRNWLIDRGVRGVGL